MMKRDYCNSITVIILIVSNDINSNEHIETQKKDKTKIMLAIQYG